MNPANQSYRARLIGLVLGLALCWSHRPGLGQERFSDDWAREFVAQTEELAAAGQLDEAIARTQRALARAQGASGEARLLFAGAWLYAERAKSAQPDQREAYLKRAVRQYRQILRKYPGHYPASDNLAGLYLQLGELGEAFSVLERINVEQISAEQNYRRLVRMGDVLRRRGDVRRAYSTYLQAEELWPENGQAQERLVDLYPQLPASWGEGFLIACERFARTGHTQAARRGYEAILQRATEGGDAGAYAETALVRWLQLEASEGALSLESLQRLPQPQTWDHPGLTGLVNLIRRPLLVRAETLPFWTGNPVRRHVLATALQALAFRQRLAGHFEPAAALYEHAYALCPDPGDYGAQEQLQEEPIAKLDIALDLAGLYNAHPQLDPGQQKFKRIENELLMEKNQAYGERNLRAIEKFHVMFGLIYSNPSRHRWTQHSLRAAPYHLERAVRTAQRLAQRNPEEYKPLPHLIQIHADGLATNKLDLRKAHRLYLDAAQGYIDEEALGGAKQALDSADRLASKLHLAIPPKQTGLKQILRVKTSLRTKALKELGRRPLRSPMLLDPQKWQVPQRVSGLDPAFLNRQQVRVLSDLSVKAYQSGQADLSRKFYSRAATMLQTQPGATKADLEKLSLSPVRKLKTGAAARKPMPKVEVRQVMPVPVLKEDRLLDLKALPKEMKRLRISPGG